MSARDGRHDRVMRTVFSSCKSVSPHQQFAKRANCPFLVSSTLAGLPQYLLKQLQLIKHEGVVFLQGYCSTQQAKQAKTMAKTTPQAFSETTHMGGHQLERSNGSISTSEVAQRSQIYAGQ